MKLSEMMKLGPPRHNMGKCLAPYVMREGPNLLASVHALGEDVPAFITGMDMIIRYIQMYGEIEDVGEVLE